MNAAYISEQGRRPEMEDAHFLDLDFGKRGWVYGGVYDGHGGKYAADFTANTIPGLFLQKYLGDKLPRQAFIEAYEETSGLLKIQDSGTTAIDFFIAEGKVYTANAGDARIIIISQTSVTQLTTDHRLENEEEKQRIIKMGGGIKPPYVTRGLSGIMPTRSIGDEYFKAVGVIATPSVNEYTITTEDIMLIAGCDGLFDFMDNEEIAELGRKYQRPDMLLEILKNEVMVNRCGSDNLTVIAVNLG